MEQQQVNANGRSMIRRSEEEILKHLDDQEKSTLTVKEYCEMFDIVEQIFYSWVKRYRTKPEDEVKSFASIEVGPVSDSYRINQDKPQHFAEIGNIKLYKEVPAEYLKSFLFPQGGGTSSE